MKQIIYASKEFTSQTICRFNFEIHWVPANPVLTEDTRRASGRRVRFNNAKLYLWVCIYTLLLYSPLKKSRELQTNVITFKSTAHLVEGNSFWLPLNTVGSMQASLKWKDSSNCAANTWLTFCKKKTKYITRWFISENRANRCWA